MATADKDIPAEVKAFIADHVASVVQLEILLMLQSSPDREWTADDVARDLRIERSWADAQLETLASQGLAACLGESPRRCRYAPRSEALRHAVSRLATTYEERRVSVISLIFSKPVDSLRAFSDAFRLRKDKPSG